MCRQWYEAVHSQALLDHVAARVGFAADPDQPADAAHEQLGSLVTWLHKHAPLIRSLHLEVARGRGPRSRGVVRQGLERVIAELAAAGRLEALALDTGSLPVRLGSLKRLQSLRSLRLTPGELSPSGSLLTRLQVLSLRLAENGSTCGQPCGAWLPGLSHLSILAAPYRSLPIHEVREGGRVGWAGHSTTGAGRAATQVQRACAAPSPSPPALSSPPLRPAQLAALPCLRSLELSGTAGQYGHELPQEVGSELSALTQLRRLSLSSFVDLPPQFPAALASLQGLVQLELHELHWSPASWYAGQIAASPRAQRLCADFAAALGSLTRLTTLVSGGPGGGAARCLHGSACECVPCPGVHGSACDPAAAAR